MKLRFPFKDYALRWKDDATVTEKLVLGYAYGNTWFNYRELTILKYHLPI